MKNSENFCYDEEEGQPRCFCYDEENGIFFSAYDKENEQNPFEVFVQTKRQWFWFPYGYEAPTLIQGLKKRSSLFCLREGLKRFNKTINDCTKDAAYTTIVLLLEHCQEEIEKEQKREKNNKSISRFKALLEDLDEDAPWQLRWLFETTIRCFEKINTRKKEKTPIKKQPLQLKRGLPKPIQITLF